MDTVSQSPKQLPEGRGMFLRILTYLTIALFLGFVGILFGAFVIGIEYFAVLATVLALSGLAVLWVVLILIFSLVAFLLEIRHARRIGKSPLKAFSTFSFGILFLTLGSFLWIFFGFLG